MPVINGPMPIEHVWRYRVLFVGGIFVAVFGSVIMGSWKVTLLGLGMIGLYVIIGDEDIWKKEGWSERGG